MINEIEKIEDNTYKMTCDEFNEMTYEISKLEQVLINTGSETEMNLAQLNFKYIVKYEDDIQQEVKSTIDYYSLLLEKYFK